MKRGFSISSGVGCALLVVVMLAGAGRFTGYAQETPKIFEARFEGKKLIVIGEHFSSKAKIFIDGVAEKTKNLEDDPTGTLVAKKGRKRVDANQIVTLSVVNRDGIASREFRFFGGPTITLIDQAKTFSLSVGEQFLVSLGGGYGWTVDYAELSTHIIAVPILRPLLGTQGVFEPVSPGKTILRAHGEPDCGKQDPSCPQAPITFEVTIFVQEKNQ